MKIKAGIVGAAGFAGAELTRLLLRHPSFELCAITSDALAGRALAEVYPAFAGASDLVFSKHDKSVLADLDVAFLAVPHTASLAMTPELIAAGTTVIDLSADYRLKDPAIYEKWYKVAHTSTDLLAKAAFGLPELTGDELARRGYRVLLLDTQHPYRGQRFNPLRQVLDLLAEGRDQEAEQAADAIAELVVQDDEKGKGSHWTASARGLLSALVLLVSMSDKCPEESKHLATVCEVLDRGTEAEGDDPAEPLKSVFRALPSGHPAKNRASQFVSSGGNELRSILSTLKVALRPFSSAPVAWMTSGSDIDPRSVLENKSAVFLHVLDEGSPYNCIAAIFLSQLWASVQAAADSNGGRLPRPVQILGDEWGNLPRVECLPALLSLGRAFQIYWTGATQDISQLNKYGERDGRRKILANCGVKVAMKLAEEEDRRYFTELIGKTTRHTQGTSSSKAASGSSASTSYSESADDVVHAWEWRDMAPDRDGIVVVKHADNGMPTERAGVFRSPVTDCTKTPTKEHFDLGTPEHETEKRRAYQRRLDEAAAGKMGERVIPWCLEWPEPKKKAKAEPTGKFSGLSLD